MRSQVRTRPLALLCALAFAFLFAVPAYAYEVFVQYEGISGGATDGSHKGWVKATAYEFENAKPGGGATGQSRRRGGTVLGDITVTKAVDKATPKLLEANLKGKVFPRVVIEVTPNKSPGSPFLRITLKNVLITKVRHEPGPRRAQRPVEKTALNYEGVTWEFLTTKGKVSATWKR